VQEDQFDQFDHSEGLSVVVETNVVVQGNALQYRDWTRLPKQDCPELEGSMQVRFRVFFP